MYSLLQLPYKHDIGSIDANPLKRDIGTMTIFSKNFAFPQKYTGTHVTVFPTDIAFASSDLKAVMASKSDLRLWSTSEWPKDDFNVQENIQDLKCHIEDNELHSAYGFMLYDSTRKICFGSLYINPIDPLNFKNELPEINEFDARLDCWLRTDLDDSLKIGIIRDIMVWLRDDWQIGWLLPLGLLCLSTKGYTKNVD